MNISPKIRSSRFVAGFLTVAFAIIFASGAHAQVFLLKIDDSNPGATVITYTGSAPDIAPSTTVGPYPIVNGFDLLGFFNPPVTLADFTVTSSSLIVGNGSNTLAFNQADVDNFGASNAQLGIYFSDGTGNDSSTISFTSGSPAFAGTLTLNLAGYTLPSIGTTGTIQTGFNGVGGGPHTAIGEWEIVSPVSAPEPATWALLLGSVALLPLARRFRRA